ncbi:uncharacterized protein LOC109794123 [Cajanus cajan]|uniref:uncharacterized protein LOC109794123 n=1 Tax=Cajanus cajan TaxID=3821 RepID=UPI00098D7990|nr:uncharacterized protein LOC109794123 [Cajanus cajan]
MEIKNLNPAVAMDRLNTTLKPGPFVNSLCKKPPLDMNDLRRRAEKYMQMEELTESRNQARAETMPYRRENEKESYQKNKREDTGRGYQVKRPRYTEYTPLNTTRTRILEQALASEILSIPKRAHTPPRADLSKSCSYHQNHGHSTEECAALKDKVEELIKQGQLKKYVENQGGFAGGGATSSARKRYLRAVKTVNFVEKRKKKMPTITFTDKDFEGVDPDQDDPMVISVEINNCIVKKTLIDQGSSADILYWKTFKQLGIPEEELKHYDEPLVGFSGERVTTKGCIELYTRFGYDQEVSKIIRIRYIVVNANTSYNILLGRPSINTLGAIVSTPHLAMKFPGESQKIITIHADQKVARECYMESLKVRPMIEKEDKNIHMVSPEAGEMLDTTELDPRLGNEDLKVEPNEETLSFWLGEKEGQNTYIGSKLGKEEKEIIQEAVRKNKELFAWAAEDMPGIDPTFHCHRLAICKEAKPVAQRKRKIGEERRRAVETEVQKLASARFIREVQYTTWLANVVMVKKANEKWRMCVDYTDLNKACPKDAYPLPNIDRLVDGAAGHQIFSFLDAYSGYNQIRMYPGDESKNAFITESANYCYKVMPFGLKNAGATYQRMMDKIFHKQIGRNVEVYVDDMVVKSNSAKEHIKDLKEVFNEIRKYRMRLNPEKCVFGVQGGKFLGFMLSVRGIQANPDKCQMIPDMRNPKSIKEVQQLIGRLTSLSRFIPRLLERTKPILKLLKKIKEFQWTEECEETFQALKETLASPPILTKPDTSKELIVYLSVSEEAVSTVLVQEEEGKQQPIYFVSRTLPDAETRYQLIEKAALSLVYAGRRLRQYFQSHSIVVRTDCPIAKILKKPELAGRMMAWAMELSEFNIRYEQRGPIKAQVLADFVNELNPKETIEEGWWSLHTDGSSNSQGSGAGIILEGPNKCSIEQSLRFNFKASNNQAEYEALIAGLRLAKEMNVQKIKCHTDSKIVVEQIKGTFQIKEPHLLNYFHLFQRIKDDFEEVQVQHIPRNDNERADRLARLASSRKPGHLNTLLQHELQTPSIESKECCQIETAEKGWMEDILNYMNKGELPQDPLQAKKVKTNVARYVLIAGEL